MRSDGLFKLKDETGNVYGRLTVKERSNNYEGVAMWLCQCECGKRKFVEGRLLRNGMVRSCGCLRSEKLKERNINGGRNRLGFLAQR